MAVGPGGAHRTGLCSPELGRVQDLGFGEAPLHAGLREAVLVAVEVGGPQVQGLTWGARVARLLAAGHVQRGGFGGRAEARRLCRAGPQELALASPVRAARGRGSG